MMVSTASKRRESLRAVNLYTLNQWVNWMARVCGKTRLDSQELDGALPSDMNDAFERAAICVLKELSPRAFVDLMTWSSSELGRSFKRGLRDAIYQRGLDARKKF
jgi:hypothetical protein